MSFSDLKNLLVEDNDGVRQITFNRPKALNALNKDTLNEGKRVLEATQKDASIDVVILTGSGEKAFVAGADINEMANADLEQARAFAQQGHDVMNTIEQLPQPVIAAVNGYALGGGTELALACDFIYASENAVFGLPEVSLGLIPGFGGTQRMSRKVPIGMARELVMTGAKIKADEALRIGLANKVLPLDALLSTAHKTAQTIRKQSSLAVEVAKKAMVEGHDLPLQQGCEIEISTFAKLFTSDHPKEGTSAFLEKRKPNFPATTRKS